MAAQSRKKKTAPATLRIEGELTIFRAAELKQALLGCPPPGVIDLSDVTEIDTAGVQLLLLAKKASIAEQRTLRLVAHSAAVSEVFDLLKIGSYFGDPELIPPQARAAAGAATTASEPRH